MKKILILLFALSFLDFIAPGTPAAKPDKTSKKYIKLVERWNPGTSSGVFNDYSQKEFDELSKSGIKYVELGLSFLNKKTQAESEEWIRDFREKADKAGIKVWSIHLPFSKVRDISTLNTADREGMIAECSRIMALCSPLKPGKYIIHPSSEPISDEERPERIRNCITSLKILTEEVKKYDAQLALEDLPRTCLGNTSEELLLIVKGVGNGLGICFDTNHLLKEKPQEFAAKVGHMIVTVHISDFDGIDERHWLPGEGIIDWNKIIMELAKSGYRGPWMYETSRSKPSGEGSAGTGQRLTAMDLSENLMKLKRSFLEKIQ